MTITKILRKRKENARVILDNKLSVKIPVALAVLGNDIPESDVISKEVNGLNDYFYKTIVPADPVRKERLIHPISELEAKKFSFYIKNAIYKHIHLLKKHYDEDFFNEVFSKVFLHLYERDYFVNFNETTPIQSYISVAVKRLFIDWNRSNTYSMNEKAFSLNNSIGEEGDTFLDFLSDDRIHVEEVVVGKMLLQTLCDFAEGYNDGFVIPGVPGTSLIHHLVEGNSIDNYPLPDPAYKNLFKKNANLFIKDMWDYYKRTIA